MEARRRTHQHHGGFRIARRRLRMISLVIIGLASIAAGVWLQFSTRDEATLGQATNVQLLGILGLLVLPALSLMLVVAERRRH